MRSKFLFLPHFNILVNIRYPSPVGNHPSTVFLLYLYSLLSQQNQLWFPQRAWGLECWLRGMLSDSLIRNTSLTSTAPESAEETGLLLVTKWKHWTHGKWCLSRCQPLRICFVRNKIISLCKKSYIQTWYSDNRTMAHVARRATKGSICWRKLVWEFNLGQRFWPKGQNPYRAVASSHDIFN